MKVYLRKRDHSPYYHCLLKWQENGKQCTKEVSTGIPIKGSNKRKAEKKAEEIKKEYEEKYEYGCVDDCDILFSDYIVEWLEGYKYNVRQSTYEGYTKTIKTKIEPYFKKRNIKLGDLKPQDIQRFYTSLLDSGLSANSVKHCHANIRKSLQDALMQNRILYNPADRVRLPKVAKFHADVFTVQQLYNILMAVKGSVIESAVVLGAYYGLRRSEICGLEWGNIDFNNKVIHIRKTRTRQLHEIVEDKTKSESSRRDLPLIPIVEKFLLQLKENQDKNRQLMGTSYIDNDYVCVWEDGKPVRCDYISRNFSMIVNNLGYAGTFHSLRHTAGTMISNCGTVSLKTVQDFLGHSDIATTQDYLHPDFEQYKKAVGIMENNLQNEKVSGTSSGTSIRE